MTSKIISLRSLRLCVIFFVFIRSPVVADSIVHVPMNTGSAWEFTSTGPYEGWADRRELFTIHYPWTASKADQFGAVSNKLTVPADWTGRVRVHFYMTDDYDGQAPPVPKESWVGQIKLMGHRFKQVLVDDEMVWEADVADAEGAAEKSRFSILLPERLKPGQTFRLTFRMIDKVATDQRLPNDFRHIGATDSNETDEWKWMTHLYVGDVAITPESTETIFAGESPVLKKVRELHAKNWPIKSLSPKPEFPITLNWEGVDEITGLNCAIHCGIPLPEGSVVDVKQLVLKDGNGKELPLQVKRMNYWPDDSPRWIEIDTVALASKENRQLRLDLSEKEAPPLPTTRAFDGVYASERKIQAMDLKVFPGGPGEALITKMESGGPNTLDNLVGLVTHDGLIYECAIEERKILVTGPVRAEVELTGQIKQKGEPPIGRFVFRVSAFKDQPYVRITWRVFNDRTERLKITRLELAGKYATTEPVTYWGQPGKHAKGNVRLLQPTTQPFEVRTEAELPIDQGAKSRGFLGVSDANGSLVVQVRHFHEQAPKALKYKNERLHIVLFKATKDEPAYEPWEGEAKRHEIWLGLWDKPLCDEEMDKWSRYFARPARLFNAKYFAESGGLGHAASADENNFADLLTAMREQYGDLPASLFYKTGIRHWGDMPYNAEKKQWCNGYYDRQQGMAAAYLVTGDPRWFDHLEATVRHIIDVDICHASKAHPEWIGMIHGLFSPDHASEGPWFPQQRMKGALSYWRLTGDRDARDAALGLADAIVRHKYGIGFGSVREQAGPFYSLMAAYDETGDKKYLEAAKLLAHDIIAHTDRRRGCYSETHGTLNYRGNVPWMDVQASEPMYDYYCASGDIDAALAVVGFAESIITENCTRGVPGDIFGYSHNPHFGKNSAYHIAIAPAILYAYELTGDAEFLAHGRAMLPQTLREKMLNPVQNCFWNTPAYLYYLRAYEKN